MEEFGSTKMDGWKLLNESLFRTKLLPQLKKILYPSLTKKLLFWMMILILAEIIHMAVLYQMEIITIWIAKDKFVFEFPFYLGGSVNIWVARDIWYSVDFISRVLVYCGLYKLFSSIMWHRYGMKLNLIYNIKNIFNGKYDKQNRHK